MGAQLSEHRGKFFAGGPALWYVGAMLLAAAGFSLVSGISDIQSGALTIGDVLTTTALAGGLGTVILIVPVLRWRQTATCYEGGIVWKRLIGTKTIPRAHLVGVQLIFHRGRSGNFDEVDLKTKDGYVSIKGIAEAELLANHIRAWLAQSASAEAGAPPPASPAGGWTPPGQAGGWQPPG